jgi:hypothetical protein
MTIVEPEKAGNFTAGRMPQAVTKSALHSGPFCADQLLFAVEYSSLKTLPSLHHTDPGWGPCHDDIVVLQLTKLSQFLQNSKGGIEHETDVSLLPQTAVDLKFDA